MTHTVADLGEGEVIRRIVAAAPSSRNGDDAAVLAHANPNTRAVASTDMLVDGVHFSPAWSHPEEIGRKAIVANFADIQAMGARPIAALLAISAPGDTPIELLEGIARGIEHEVVYHSAELVGGDVTRGKQLVLSVTAIGLLGGDRPPLTLKRARAGQKLVAHGRIGWSAAGLALLQRYGREHVPPRFQPLVDAHCAPSIMPNRGIIARSAGATAMTDNSDGLVKDLGLIAAKSGVGIDLDPYRIGPGQLMEEVGIALGTDPWEWILGGGEDHTLMATIAGEAPSGFREIGSVVMGEGVTVGGNQPAVTTGWDSF